MSENTLDNLGLNLVEMRCPHCNSLQQIRSRCLSLEPRLTKCCTCQQLLIYQLAVKTKPNHILLALQFTPVLQTATEQDEERGSDDK